MKQNFSQTLFPTKEQLLKSIPKDYKKVELFSNHYKISLLTNGVTINEYSVKFIKTEDENIVQKFNDCPQDYKNDIEQDARQLQYQVYGSVKNKIQKEMGRNCQFSGFQCYQMIAATQQNLTKDSFCFKSDDQSIEYAIGLQLVNKGISHQQLVANQEQRKPFIRYLNITMKNLLKQNDLIEYGKSKQYYNLKVNKVFNQFDLKIYQGFFQTFELREGKGTSELRMIADISNRIVQNKNVWQMICDKFAKNSNDPLKIIKTKQSQIQNFLIDRSVCTTYTKNFNKYIIEKIDFKQTPQSKMDQKRTFCDYYLERYKYQIKVQNQFLLQTSRIDNVNGKRVKVIQFLIPELVSLTGMTDEQKSDNGVQREISKETVIPIDQRFQRIQQGLEENLNKTNTVFKISTMDNKVIGYQIPKPVLQIDKKKTSQIKSEKIQYTKMYSQKEFSNWFIITDFKHKKYCNDIVNGIQKAMKSYGVDVKWPTQELLPDDSEGYYQNSEKFSKFLEAFQEKQIKVAYPNIILFVISKNMPDFIYGNIKKFYQTLGVPVQFYNSFHEQKDLGSLSKFSNIGIQMVNKLGGRSHLIQQQDDDSIVIGIDYSIIKMKNSDKGCLSLVAQYGKNLEKYYSTFTTHKIEKLQKNQSGAIDEQIVKLYEIIQKKQTKKIFKKIIIYRMGLSEDQINHQIDQELIPLKQKLFEKFNTNRPKVTFIVVNKKINDRFMSIDKKNLESTVIMDEIVKADRANFYMIPQYVNRGSATPVHYQIIDNDDSDITFAQIVTMTLNLCWDYQNWPGPIRVPAPLKLAEKLSQLQVIAKNSKMTSKMKSTLFML